MHFEMSQSPSFTLHKKLFTTINERDSLKNPKLLQKALSKLINDIFQNLNKKDFKTICNAIPALRVAPNDKSLLREVLADQKTLIEVLYEKNIFPNAIEEPFSQPKSIGLLSITLKKKMISIVASKEATDETLKEIVSNYPHTTHITLLGCTHITHLGISYLKLLSHLSYINIEFA